MYRLAIARSPTSGRIANSMGGEELPLLSQEICLFGGAFLARAKAVLTRRGLDALPSKKAGIDGP